VQRKWDFDCSTGGDTILLSGGGIAWQLDFCGSNLIGTNAYGNLPAASSGYTMITIVYGSILQPSSSNSAAVVG
jgi:hypothetical protein